MKKKKLTLQRNDDPRRPNWVMSFQAAGPAEIHLISDEVRAIKDCYWDGGEGACIQLFSTALNDNTGKLELVLILSSVDGEVAIEDENVKALGLKPAFINGRLSHFFSKP
jgi:hypothetical protein